MNSPTLLERITADIDDAVVSTESLSGGCVGQVYLVRLESGDRIVAKIDTGPEPCLDIEARMLRYLADHSDLPVPQVRVDEPELLVMEYIEHDGRSGPDVAIEAADALASLHDVGADSYGFEYDTLIGGLRLPNPQSQDWPAFFAEHRLVDMAHRAADADMLDTEIVGRIESLAADIGDYIDDPNGPSLIHGDIWGGNVLSHAGHLQALIDPAIYYADPEVELAFISLFNTFGARFYERYAEHRPIDDGFFEVRRDLYNLFPLLVHVRLFGGTYVDDVETTLEKFGV